MGRSLTMRSAKKRKTRKTEDSKERKKRLTEQRERQRKIIAAETQLQKSQRLNRISKYIRNKRILESENKRFERLQKMKEHAQITRSLESEGERAMRLQKAKKYEQLTRTLESEDKRFERLQQMKEHAQITRSLESEGERAMRLQKAKEYEKLTRTLESEDKRFERLQQMKGHAQITRSLESEGERAMRLQKAKEYEQLTRTLESEDKRNIRLQQMKEHAQITRSLESERERAKRLQKSKKRMQILRSFESEKDKSMRLQYIKEHNQAVRISKQKEKVEKRRSQSECIRNIRFQESEDERSLRLRSLSENASVRRSLECKEERLNRLSTMRQYAQQRRLVQGEEQFFNDIRDFAENPCCVCHKMLYKKQKYNLNTSNPRIVTHLPTELQDKGNITACQRCSSNLSKGKIPSQAYWNNMTVEETPPCLQCLSDVEKRMLSRVVPFLRMIKMNNRVSQQWLKGQVVLFAQDVVEVAEQLPLSLNKTGLIIICESLETLRRHRQFQIDPAKLQAALKWLLANNPLYRDVVPIIAPEYNINEIVQIVEAQRGQNVKRTEYVQINEHIAILRGTMHQSHPYFNESSRGKQCTAMAGVAIMAKNLTNVLSWTPNDIDLILLAGDRYYSQSKNEFNINEEYLMATDLSRSFEFDNINVLVDISENMSINGHLLNDNTTDGFPNLFNGMNIFFESFTDGILTCNSQSVALMKTINVTDTTFYWLFDSHSRGPKGFIAPTNGTACCMKFTNIASLHATVKRNLMIGKNQGGNQFMCNLYSITPIKVYRTDNIAERNLNQDMNILSTTKPNTLSSQVLRTKERFSNEFSTFPKSGSDANELESHQLLLSTSMLRAADDVLPDINSIINIQQENPTIQNIRRKTMPPLNLDKEKRMEELSWYYLFPFGRNGFGEHRNVPITALDYFQVRIMGSDQRFNRNDYLFFALSVVEFYRAKSSIGVCCRLRQGDSTPDNLVENIHLAMRNIRGSAAYWSRACSELIAMIKTLGPPTWFITLSCNDLNWSDILKALLLADRRNEVNVNDLSFEERLDLVERHPVTLSRQFMVKVHALLRFIKGNNTVLGGPVVDWWLRIEFQNRGSPHVHMLVWCQDVPDFYTREGINIIDKVVTCSLNMKSDLNDLVIKLQTHKHTATCFKDRNVPVCRFGFPRPIIERTECLEDDEAQKNKGRFCNIKRSSSETMINNYNEILLRLWQGNMDIQPCGSISAVAYYVAKYASKSEPNESGDVVKEAIRGAKRKGGDTWHQLFSVSMALLNQRLVSAPECAFRLCHLPLKLCSRTTVFINSCRPQYRYRMLRFEGGENTVYNNIIDYYENRPDAFSTLSLAEFAVRYETVTNTVLSEEDGDAEMQYIENARRNRLITLNNGRLMRERTRPAVLRHRYFTIDGDRESFYYSLILCHIPFRQESDLLNDGETAEQCFLRRQRELKPIMPNMSAETFTHAELIIQQALAQATALRAARQTDNPAEQNVVQNIYRDDIVADEYEDYAENFNVSAMPDSVFQCNIKSLNVEQKSLFKNISTVIERDIKKEQTEQTLLFITGGAGCGKTFVLKLIVELIRRCYAPTVEQLEKPIFVEITAVTGVAARQISGKTLHSVFNLPIEKGHSITYKALTGVRLEQQRRKWRHTKWLIIDEISMLSYELLRIIHLRLQEFKLSTSLFGGVHVLVFGDLMQLPPVNGHWCFIKPPCYDAEIHLWQQFSICELSTVMRQKDDLEFIDLLNNLRFGKMTTAQLEILLQRSRVPLSGIFEDGAAVRVFPTLKLVDNYNSKMITHSKERVYTFKSIDESREATTYGKVPPSNVISDDPNKCGGLLGQLQLSIGSRIMLRRNISVSEGLVNGSMGVVKRFLWPALRRDQLEVGELPDAVLILFDDPTIGTKSKNKDGYIAVSPVTVTFQAKRSYGDVERRMLPLILSWAVTVHKLQGTTLETAVVNLGKSLFAKGQAYVALSRVKTLDGLAIDELDTNKLLKHPHDLRAYQKMLRLRNNSQQ